MADFEDESSKLNISLYVLPPATPKYNGDVERVNRTLREEFYRNPKLLTNSIRDMRVELQKMLKKNNEYRPHAGLNGLTPAEYVYYYFPHPYEPIHNSYSRFINLFFLLDCLWHSGSKDREFGQVRKEAAVANTSWVGCHSSFDFIFLIIFY